VFTEVEGMTELNNVDPIKISGCRAYDFKLELDTRNFGVYKRQGLVEDKKVKKPCTFHSLAESLKNPGASSPEGMLMTVDFKLFGRSDQLHISMYAVQNFRDTVGRYPENKEEDLVKVVALAKEIAADLKSKELMCVEEVEEDVVRKCAAYSTCSITAQCAFLGGFVA
jgi:hypothetical protein